MSGGQEKPFAFRPEDEEKVSALCTKLGSPPEQARVMARQMLKRADQLARRHDVEPLAALDWLLRAMISGRQGDTPPQAPWEQGSGPPQE